jgi:hypothetical protein
MEDGSKLMPFLLSVTSTALNKKTSLDKNTKLVWNLYITDPKHFLVQATGLCTKNFLRP